MKKISSDKIGAALFALFACLVLIYTVNYFFQKDTGKIETETVFSDYHEQVLEVKGFAVRDEAYISGDKNLAILNKQEGKVYVPVIDDGENVAKNGVVAIAFDTQKQADNYLKVQQLKLKLESVKSLQNSQKIDFESITDLNSQTSSNIREYIAKIYGGDAENLSSLTESIVSSITAKQIAIGADIDLSAVIKSYEKQIKKLESTYSADNKIISPFAGYFVSNVDGFEGAASYEDVKEKKIPNGMGAELLSQKPATSKNAYGKIISRHTWYYIFDIERGEASEIATGATVNVSFDELGIDNLKMTVYSTTEKVGDTITITLKSTSLNDTIVNLRKEPASIRIKRYSGFRISSEALKENEDGLMGAYVLVGNVVKFAPLKVEYYGEGFVIALPSIPQAKEDETEEEAKKRRALHKLKQYDQIIVKGIHLDHGIVVS